MTWTIDGAERHAIVYSPAKSTKGKVPVVFAFHGGGDTAEHFTITGFQDAWKEALIVYMQGLPRDSGPGGAFQNTDVSPANPDLKFFDAALAELRQTYRIDDQRIYAAGFSNGARFVYLLWATRSQTFAGFAAVAGSLAPQVVPKDPKSLILIGGRQDRTVGFESQLEALEKVRVVNGATADGEPCGKNCTLYRSSRRAPVITYLHDGGHLYPSEATDIIVSFFRAHP
jgi:polyhydroxybutyrate depolymerase